MAEDMKRRVALGNEILRGVVGSTVHGTAIEGQDDRDEMGIFIEPAEYVCGLWTCDHYIYRDQPTGVRSEPGDLDLTMYSLRKFCHLAAKGNPSVLLLLWLPTYLNRRPAGDCLLNLRDAFVSKEAGARFLGYLTSQKKALKGERSKKVQRPDLVEKYGFDTKFAMHALRLGYQGIEYLTERRITMPVPDPELTTLRALRGGEISYTDAVKLIEDTEARLVKVIEDTKLGEAKYGVINDFLVKTHTHHWKTHV